MASHRVNMLVRLVYSSTEQGQYYATFIYHLMSCCKLLYQWKPYDL